jgi:hypothetical protein
VRPLLPAVVLVPPGLATVPGGITGAGGTTDPTGIAGVGPSGTPGAAGDTGSVLALLFLDRVRVAPGPAGTIRAGGT